MHANEPEMANDWEEKEKNEAKIKVKGFELKQLVAEELDKLTIKEQLEVELTRAEREQYQDAYHLVVEAHEAGHLPESVWEAMHQMMHKLGIYI